MSIRIFYDKIKFRIRNTKEIKDFLEKVIREEKRVPGDLCFIFTNDNEIIKINREFLNKNYNTDVIAFNYSEGRLINGEIYLSAETIKKNAEKFKVSKEEETYRVMIHGILHLCGYEDKDEKGRMKMFELQERKLKEYMKNRNGIQI